MVDLALSLSVGQVGIITKPSPEMDEGSVW